MDSAAIEMAFLDNLVDGYPSCDKSPQLRVIRNLIIRVIKPFIRGPLPMCLELGCEVGYMTGLLSQCFHQVRVVDGSKRFLDIAKSKHLHNVMFTHSLFEDFVPPVKYSIVLASHILEHLVNPQDTLKMVKSAVHRDGYFIAVVPNAKAASRQLALHMGIVDSLYDLTSNDLAGGHRRVYDQASLVKEVEKAGFQVVDQGGVFFKPFADYQLDQAMNAGIIGKEQIEGLYRMGKEYPTMCADSYVVAAVK